MQFLHYKNIFQRLLLIFTLGSSLFLQSQIVNIENLRKEKDSIGWSGHASLEFSIEKNRNRILAFSNQLKVQYKAKKSTLFFINDLDFKEINDATIVNNSTQHLRFSHPISKKVSYEAFLQLQTDKISEINLRALVGSGFRFSLHQSEKSNFFLGTTLMFEYEDSLEELLDDIHRDVRSSNYLSFKIHPNKNITIVSASYFQPRIDKFSDYRILSETSLIFTIAKNLKFTTSFNYLFDAFPATNAVKEEFELSNGLVYFFN